MLLKATKVINNLLPRNSFNYGITPQMMHSLTATDLLAEIPKTVKRTKTVSTIG